MAAELRDIRRPDALDLIYVNDVDACRHLINIESWRWPNGAWRIPGAAGLGAWHHDGWQGMNVAGRALGVSPLIPRKQAYRYRHKNKARAPIGLIPSRRPLGPAPVRRGCYNVTAVLLISAIDIAIEMAA
jgi:hypothetical protein